MRRVVEMSKKLNIQDIRDGAKTIFVNNNVKRAFLFGSYAYGNPAENSDIDIVIDTEGRLPFLRVCGICEELRIIFKKKIDVFDLREINNNSNIFNDIIKKGIVLYEKEQ